MMENIDYDAHLVHLPISSFSNDSSPEVKARAQEHLPKHRRRRSRTTTVACVEADGKLHAIFPTNEVQIEAARLAGDRSVRTRIARPHGQKAQGDKITATTIGVSERTARRERTRASKIGADLLDRLREETTLRTESQLDALLKLPPDIRRELIDRALAGENVSAIDAATRRETERRTGVEGQLNALLDAWENNPAGRMPFLKRLREELSAANRTNETNDDDCEHLDLMGPLGRETYKTLVGPGHSDAIDVLEKIASGHIVEKFETDYD